MSRLAVEIVARLSGPDAETAARMARLSFEDLLSPGPALASVAADRGWPQAATSAAPDAWAAGVEHELDGETALHAAYHVASGNDTIVDRLVWGAQAAVVFPFLEERRRDLLDILRPVLRVPYDYPAGSGTRRIETAEDLEIGHIYQQLRTNPHIAGQQAVDFSGALRDARNDLAHLRTLPAARFRTPAFLDPKQILETIRLRVGA